MSDPLPRVLGVLDQTYDASRYAAEMGRPISVRLDDEALRALRLLEASGLSRSEAVRSAVVASAARLRSRESLAAEVAMLDGDDADREEMAEVAALMEALRAPG